MRALNSIVLTFATSILLLGCGSHPVLPKKSDIKVSRDNPSSDCKSLGPVEGRSIEIKASSEQALEDLKSEAVKKGANYVKIEMMGAQGGSIRGEAFLCP